MKHIELYEAFEWNANGASRLIIVEGTPDALDPAVQEKMDDMQAQGKLLIIDMSLCDVADIKSAEASDATQILFINGDDCDRRIRYAVMDLHPEIIPAENMETNDIYPF
jgi:hypothetical protein